MSNSANRPILALTIASLILPAAAPVAAAPVPGSVIYTVIIPAGEFGSGAFTSVLTGGLAAAREFCGALADETYRVDCLAERIGALANSVPRNTDYDEVKQILESVSEQLATLARSNRDPSRPRARVARQSPSTETSGDASAGTSQTSTRPLTPVNSASVVQVNLEARVILDQSGTLLLRSAEGSQSKIAQYSQIADALGSNKVLLRAA